MIERGKPAEYGQEIIRRRLRLTRERVALAGRQILDFGCGNGAQTIELVSPDSLIVAVDIDANDLGVLADQLRTRKIGSVLPVQYDGERIPVASASINVAVSFEVLEHVRDEATVLREIHRVLAPSGEFVLTVPNKGWLFETHGAHLPLLPWNRVPMFSWLPKSLHERYAKARIYRRKDIVRLLTSLGFDVLETQYVTAPMDVVTQPWLKRILRTTIFRGDTTRVTFLATAILVHCRKRA